MEEVWKTDTSPARDLYQGLIQVAVACHHIRRENRPGALKMLRAALPKLSKSIDVPRGIVLGPLLESIEKLEAEIARGDDLASAKLPTIAMR